jgi:polyisoprenoid-binding protein YceI
MLSLALIAAACGGDSDSTAAAPISTAVAQATVPPMLTLTPMPTPTPAITTSQSSPPETSSLTTTDTPVPGSTNGTFVVSAGSEVTFTVNEKLSALPLPNDAVLRTGEITGEIDLFTATASLVIDLHSLKSDESRRDRYVHDRLFPRQPEATIHVSVFPDIPETFAEGESFTSTVTGTVNVNGVDAEIEFELEARLDPDRLLVLAKGDFTWADFGMSAPTSRSFIVRDDVHVEMLVSAIPN